MTDEKAKGADALWKEISDRTLKIAALLFLCAAIVSATINHLDCSDGFLNELKAAGAAVLAIIIYVVALSGIFRAINLLTAELAPLLHALIVLVVVASSMGTILVAGESLFARHGPVGCVVKDRPSESN